MKNISAKIILVIFLFFIFSCSSDKISDNIYGKWQVISMDIQGEKNNPNYESLINLINSVNNGEVIIIQDYSENKTYKSTVEINSESFITSKGIFEIDENDRKIIKKEQYTFNEDKLSLEKNDNTDEKELQIISISASKMVATVFFEGFYFKTTYKKL